MENIYTAYTKIIESKTYYFVKKFLAFPEYQNVEPVLESYGMHTDFNKACNIAGVYDAAIKERLLHEANGTLQQAKIIDLKSGNFSGKSKAL
jgi:hypothetical protein